MKKYHWDQAIADFNRVLELDPQNAKSFYMKAELFYEAGKNQEALEAYRNFLKYAPPQVGDYIQPAQEKIKALEKDLSN